MRRERDDDVGDDVRQHHVVAAAELFGHLRVRDHVAGHGGEAVGIEAVHRGVLARDVLRLGVDVHAHGGSCAELQRGDGQNAAAAAEIEHPLAARDAVLQRAHTHLRGRVRARAEDHAGVKANFCPALRVFRVQPLRHNEQTLADGQRLVILLPAIFPVLVAHILQNDHERAKVHLRELCAQGGKLLREEAHALGGIRRLLQIQPNL